MSFRDDIAADIAVFLNSEEFGETHTVDGNEIVCVLSSSDGQFAGDVDAGGAIYLTRWRLFVREQDLAQEPAVGKRMLIDGCPYVVLDISREMGMLSITLDGSSPA